MAAPAVVASDKVMGSCATHLVPGPGGAPITSPAPLPFSAPLTAGLATTVTIGGKFAAVQGSSGVNTPPHPGLHASDPYLSTPQQGKVVKGSGTVTFNGKPAAYGGCQVSCCASAPAALAGSAATVQVGQ
jgi:uncharacterized Zn-binding protein involved in type VI secretion